MEYNLKQEQSLHKKGKDQQAQCFAHSLSMNLSIILCLPINYLCIFFLPVFMFVSTSVSQPVPLSHISFVLSRFSRGKYDSGSVRCNWARAAWEQFLSNNEPPFASWALPVPGVLLNCSLHKLIFPAILTFRVSMADMNYVTSVTPLEHRKSLNDVVLMGVEQRRPFEPIVCKKFYTKEASD